MCAPTIEETIIFEQEQRSRELKEELETTLNFLMKIITSATTPAPQILVISNSEEEVEIIPQFVVEEQTKQVSTSRPMEEKELQQLVSSGKEFIQKLFEEESVCNIIL